MEMLNVKFMKHGLMAMDNEQHSQLLRLDSQFGVLMERGKKQFCYMMNGGKPSENEPENITLSLEAYKMSIITRLIAPKNTNRAQMYIHYWL